MNKKQKKCKHENEPYDCYITIKGIRRQAMRCPDCHLIMDYYPQYDDD